MPARIRHSPLGAGLSLADLNILPFLAPRLLQAWPRSRRGQRTQSTASARLESPVIQPLNGHGQSSSASAASRQAPPSGDKTSHPQPPYGPSYERIDGRRGPTITRTSIKPPALSPVDGTGLYPQTRTGDTPGHNQTRSVLTDLYPEATDGTPSRQEESSNLTHEDATAPYFSETHLNVLNDFLKANRKDKDVEESRQYLGQHWEVFFNERRDENQRKHNSHGSKRSRQIESIANFHPSMDIYDLRLEWKSIPRKYRRVYWPGLMLDILCKRPDDSLKFLVATLADPLPNRACIEDSLDYIIEYHLYRQSHSPISPRNFAVLFEAINDLLTGFISSKIRISNYALYHICKHADRYQAETLLGTLSRRGQEVSPNLRLHFVDFLARRGATDSAVTLLTSMHRDGVVDFTEPRVTSICATLLRCSQQNPEAIYSESHIYSLFLGWGIRPSIIFYTILAHNAFESLDQETAWNIYDLIIENGIEPSNHTYSIFLHNAKLRGDQEALENILEGVKANNVRNEYVATDLLHAMLLVHENKARGLRGEEAQASSKSLFQRMVSLYSIYFELAPLEDFAPEYFTMDGKLSPEAEGRRMHPDRATLSLMMSAAIRCRIEQSELPLFYNRFKGLVDAGHPDFVNVATEVNVFDAFIRAMGQDRDTLAFTTQILGDMLGAEARGVKLQSTGIESNDRKKIVYPTVQTWSILVHAFMRQGQPRAAEKLVTMMKSRGVDPNRVTWNTLITGYLHMRNMAGAMHSYERAREEGWTIDESICDNLGIPNHQRMLDEQSETMPRTAGSQEPLGDSQERPDPQYSLSSPERVPSLHRAEFQTGEMLDFMLGTELKRVEIVAKLARLLKSAKGSPTPVRAGMRRSRLKKARNGLKKLEGLVDDRLYELEEVSEV